MKRVRAKKSLGQHFLNDQHIARQIVEAMPTVPATVIEVGPGMGVLTRFLSEIPEIDLWLVEVDRDSVAWLRQHYPQLSSCILSADFLKLNLEEHFTGPLSIIGNFPYNISSQIFFKVLDNRSQVTSVTGMVQREVGRRLTSPPGSREYGILSVLMQAFYHPRYLFTVDEHVFSPPPKVKSAVVQFTRNQTTHLPCNEKLFFRVVKTAFNQRRKTLSNSLKPLGIQPRDTGLDEMLRLRPEQLSVEQFSLLTNHVEPLLNGSNLNPQ